MVSPWIRPRIVDTWPAPCISGAAGSITPGPALSAARSRSASGRSTFSLLYASMPPHSAKKMSSWRHITPFGMPVVPPV